ncbi:hypothetical protein FRB93_007227 [Tulasnella sp. JGI-2019a]|nr:hypothetical protein FRB93_007227 [Tulasnella sp. JGI-2019a]
MYTLHFSAYVATLIFFTASVIHAVPTRSALTAFQLGSDIDHRTTPTPGSVQDVAATREAYARSINRKLGALKSLEDLSTITDCELKWAILGYGVGFNGDDKIRKLKGDALKNFEVLETRLRIHKVGSPSVIDIDQILHPEAFRLLKAVINYGQAQDVDDLIGATSKLGSEILERLGLVRDRGGNVAAANPIRRSALVLVKSLNEIKSRTKKRSKLRRFIEVQFSFLADSISEGKDAEVIDAISGLELAPESLERLGLEKDAKGLIFVAGPPSSFRAHNVYE